jgi:hypothetical protein
MMIKTIGIFQAFLFMALPAAAQEGDCRVSFARVSGAGQFTALTLYNFGQHMELQADIPGQESMQDFALLVDGAATQTFPQLGLDDLLVGFPTDASELKVDDALLGQLAKGREATVAANLNGKSIQTKFSLKGSASAIKRVKGGCKGG